jgi:hypothetical protein
MFCPAFAALNALALSLNASPGNSSAGDARETMVRHPASLLNRHEIHRAKCRRLLKDVRRQKRVAELHNSMERCPGF